MNRGVSNLWGQDHCQALASATDSRLPVPNRDPRSYELAACKTLGIARMVRTGRSALGLTARK